jgi:prepilin-type N-terminal cleavage/methylation domain-containing protein
MPSTRRRGFTIIELLIVLAILIVLGVVLVPSVTSFEGNVKQRGAADQFRARLAEAHAKAMERGIPFRVGMMTTNNQSRIRVAPDGDLFDSAQPSTDNGPDSTVTDDTLDSKVTLSINLDQGDDRNTPSSGGWTTIATMKATGDIRESLPVTVTFKQGDFQPIQIQIRGLTGQARTFRGELAQGSQDQGVVSGGPK